MIEKVLFTNQIVIMELSRENFEWCFCTTIQKVLSFLYLFKVSIKVVMKFESVN